MNDERELSATSDVAGICLRHVGARLEAFRSEALGPLTGTQRSALVLLESEIARVARELDRLAAARRRPLGHRLVAALRRLVRTAPDDTTERRYCTAGAIG
jgi:hypothetical protein